MPPFANYYFFCHLPAHSESERGSVSVFGAKVARKMVMAEKWRMGTGISHVGRIAVSGLFFYPREFSLSLFYIFLVFIRSVYFFRRYLGVRVFWFISGECCARVSYKMDIFFILRRLRCNEAKFWWFCQAFFHNMIFFSFFLHDLISEILFSNEICWVLKLIVWDLKRFFIIIIIILYKI